ncbi:MAG: TIGR03084 family metal-binding protein [Actinomycetota bacterium]
MMADVSAIIDDLRAEHHALDELVADLDEPAWDLDTPAETWMIRDQISHLAFFDEAARLAVADPARFNDRLQEIAADIQGFVDEPVTRGRALRSDEVLEWWRRARAEMLHAFDAMDTSGRVPWFGPPMSPASFVTARLMETWAHGQDIVDALGISRLPTTRLRHVAYIGVRARRNSYSARGMEMPEAEVRVTLDGPGGARWIWNEDATDSVTGDALDFCLVVTQRRHPDDTDLAIDGPLAEEWMSIAQAFAGPPGTGRAPGQFPKPVA